MIPKDPANIWPMNVDSFIKQNMILEVTSPFIFEPSSNNLHPEGLFSETIFGQIGSSERLVRFGYISLHFNVLVPLAFKNIIDLKPVYDDIMQGKQYATWNTKSKQFDVCSKETPGADTGYTYFLSHIDELEYDKTTSHTRNTKIDSCKKMVREGTIFTNKMPVYPAGFRDIKEDDGRLSVEEINKKYTTLLAIAKQVKTGLENPVLAKYYDGIKYNIQLKVYELYLYGKSLIEGKRGFGQRHYGHRGIIWGTRNVITASPMTGKSPDDPQYLKYNESLVPVFQVAKMYQPLVIYQLKSLFYSQVFHTGSSTVAGIDPKTYKITYVDVKDSSVTEALSDEASNNLIALFQNIHMRDKPVIIRDVNNKWYYMFLVYDLGDEIYLFRNIDDFKVLYEKNRGKELDIEKVRPLTYVEMLYLATYRASVNKSFMLTRYPAVEIGSIFPNFTVISTTTDDRVVKFASQYQEQYEIMLPHYPIIGKAYIDSLIPHGARTPGLNADFDGDQVSANGVQSEEGNNECIAYNSRPESVITINGKLLTTADTNLVRLTLYNLSRIPGEEE